MKVDGVVSLLVCLLYLSPTLSVYVAGVGEKRGVVACYLMFWSAYREKEGKLTVSDLDPTLCTHIIYSYNAVDPVTMAIVPLDPSADFTPGLGNLEKLVRLKDENPRLKVLVSLGGWSEGSKVFSNMASSRYNRTRFIGHALEFLSENRLDGLDIDWQYPGQRGGQQQDSENFPLLLQELRRAMDRRGGLTLMVRLASMRYVVDPVYQVPRISEAVHYINLKTFGYHGHWESKTGLHAPLSSDDESNVEFSVDYMIKLGASTKKMLLGVRPGGSAVLMSHPAQSADKGYLGVPVVDKFAGTLSQQPGFFGYNDLCWELSQKEPWKIFWHNSSSTPYAVLNNKFISYDDPTSLQLKLNLVESKGLAGVNIFSIDTDDFHGFCSKDSTFPMTRMASLYLVGPPALPLFSTSIVNSNYPLDSL